MITMVYAFSKSDDYSTDDSVRYIYIYSNMAVPCAPPSAVKIETDAARRTVMDGRRHCVAAAGAVPVGVSPVVRV